MCAPIAALGLTTGLQTALVGSSLAAAGISAYGAIQQGRTAQKTADNNAKMAEYAAQDAQKRGEEDAMAVQRRAAALKSSQRVALAANGLDLSYGTAADLQDQVDFFGQADAATTRTNASREAWRLRAGGEQDRAAGAAARSNANMQAAGTLLSAAGSVASKWYTPSSAGATGFSGTQKAAPIVDLSYRK